MPAKGATQAKKIQLIQAEVSRVKKPRAKPRAKRRAKPKESQAKAYFCFTADEAVDKQLRASHPGASAEQVSLAAACGPGLCTLRRESCVAVLMSRRGARRPRSWSS